ncbi:hypothetical protein O6H91_Y432800 [Diphasiastrum complanatum]|nr:hypothetical protein O6H91_Y432800 [Diphasiastrum complanatum]
MQRLESNWLQNVLCGGLVDSEVSMLDIGVSTYSLLLPEMGSAIVEISSPERYDLPCCITGMANVMAGDMHPYDSVMVREQRRKKCILLMTRPLWTWKSSIFLVILTDMNDVFGYFVNHKRQCFNLLNCGYVPLFQVLFFYAHPLCCN